MHSFGDEKDCAYCLSLHHLGRCRFKCVFCRQEREREVRVRQILREHDNAISQAIAEDVDRKILATIIVASDDSKKT